MSYQEIKNELKAGYRVILKEAPGAPNPYWLAIYRDPSKSRFPKPELNYVYKTLDRAQEAENRFFAQVERIQKEREARAQAKKAARENLVNPFKVGDILWDSWGYEQTNIDFYQVVGVTPRTVKIRRIYAASVPGSEYSHGMADMVKPAVNQFHESYPETLVKPLVIGWDGQPYISSTHGSFSKWTDNKEGVYRSWYA